MKKYIILFAALILVPVAAGAFSVEWGENTVNYLIAASDRNDKTPSTVQLSDWKQKEVWAEILENEGNRLIEQSNRIRASLGEQSTAGACLDLKNNLVIGSTDAATGGEVSKLQKFLKDNGFFPTANGTGYYGTLTADAVVRFQKAMGMTYVTTKSGVGPTTRGYLRDYCKG